MARLGDVFDRQITGEWGNECTENETGTKILRTSNFTSEGNINYNDVVARSIREDKVIDKRLRYGDIILEKSGGTEKTPVGRVVFCDDSIEKDIYLCNNFTQAMRVRKNLAIPRYVFYFMWNLHYSGKTDLLQNKTTGIRNLQVKSYLNQNIPLPPLDEQRKIAAVLDKVSDLIAKRRQQLDKLDTLVKARFVEMFGVYPANPMRWETGTIRDVVADVRYGSSRPAVDGGKYPYLRMNNITYGGELDLTDTKRIDVPDNELDKCTVRRGDVLFNRTNSKELVGKTCVYNRDEMMVLAGFVVRVRLTERVLPEFLVAFLNTDFSKQMLLGMCKTAIGQANINAQEMQNIGLYLPPIETQRQFVRFKKHTDKSKLAVIQSLEKLETLKKSLMQQYFG